MESGNLPIIQRAVPEKIYGGYTPKNVYEPAEGDSGFYDLFVRQMNGPAAADGSASAGNDGARQAEADMQAETDRERDAETVRQARSEAGRLRCKRSRIR